MFDVVDVFCSRDCWFRDIEICIQVDRNMHAYIYIYIYIYVYNDAVFVAVLAQRWLVQGK
jgi:hypothetical protein